MNRRNTHIRTRDIGRDVNVGNNNARALVYMSIVLAISIIALGAFTFGGKFTATDGDREVVIDGNDPQPTPDR